MDVMLPDMVDSVNTLDIYTTVKHFEPAPNAKIDRQLLPFLLDLPGKRHLYILFLDYLASSLN
jgi:hypothetical protein